MPRERVSIVLAQEPNYDEFAFKYFLLNLNKIQSTFEFSLLDITPPVYPRSKRIWTRAEIKKDFRQKLEPRLQRKQDPNRKDRRLELSDYDYIISIITSPIEKKRFLTTEDPYGWITTARWEKDFSPPSLFEYLVHAIMRTILDLNGLESHEDTFGCCRDFTRKKPDTRGDITLGYICEKHQRELAQKKGNAYVADVLKILDGRWIGSKTETDNVAYNLMRVFRFDLDTNSGFNKKTRERLRLFAQDLGKQVLSSAVLIVVAAILAFLLGRFLR